MEYEVPFNMKTHAFTLIELLIVVAIIAILAAIAVPNFLEAQTRSKVSRAKADMRSYATAIESYHVDHNEYPVPADELGDPILDLVAGPDGFETKMPVILTTPVAYMTSLIEEPFPDKDPHLAAESHLYHFTSRAYFKINHGNDEEFEEFVEDLEIGGDDTIEYFIVSHGPDLDHDEPHEAGTALYDPTNGTISNGDIAYWGPGAGFKK